MSCTIQILPCSRVVSFLVGYLHEVVGTLGRKKFNKKRLYVANEKNFIKIMALHSLEPSCSGVEKLRRRDESCGLVSF